MRGPLLIVEIVEGAEVATKAGLSALEVAEIVVGILLL